MIKSLQKLLAIPSVTGTPEVFDALACALDVRNWDFVRRM